MYIFCHAVFHLFIHCITTDAGSKMYKIHLVASFTLEKRKGVGGQSKNKLQNGWRKDKHMEKNFIDCQPQFLYL